MPDIIWLNEEDEWPPSPAIEYEEEVVGAVTIPVAVQAATQMRLKHQLRWTNLNPVETAWSGQADFTGGLDGGPSTAGSRNVAASVRYQKYLDHLEHEDRNPEQTSYEYYPEAAPGFVQYYDYSGAFPGYYEGYYGAFLLSGVWRPTVRNLGQEPGGVPDQRKPLFWNEVPLQYRALGIAEGPGGVTAQVWDHTFMRFISATRTVADRYQWAIYRWEREVNGTVTHYGETPTQQTIQNRTRHTSRNDTIVVTYEVHHQKREVDYWIYIEPYPAVPVFKDTTFPVEGPFTVVLEEDEWLADPIIDLQYLLNEESNPVFGVATVEAEPLLVEWNGEISADVLRKTLRWWDWIDESVGNDEIRHYQRWEEWWQGVYLPGQGVFQEPERRRLFGAARITFGPVVGPGLGEWIAETPHEEWYFKDGAEFDRVSDPDLQYQPTYPASGYTLLDRLHHTPHIPWEYEPLTDLFLLQEAWYGKRNASVGSIYSVRLPGRRVVLWMGDDQGRLVALVYDYEDANPQTRIVDPETPCQHPTFTGLFDTCFEGSYLRRSIAYLATSWDQGRSWTMEVIPGTYKAQASTRHKGRRVLAGWDGSAWHCRVKPDGGAWSSQVNMALPTPTSRGVFVASNEGEDVLAFCYVNTGGSPVLVKCRALTNDGQGTWS